ncbi:MAG: beta-lactamase family protein, partial [Anaerolineae bacterium]|nr:beta-lactamase family protein [Anaerolineae bacterium]
TGLGVTHVDHPLEVTDDTIFQIGSISKTFTATAALRLADQGRLDLDAPVRRYLTEFRVQDDEATEAATPRHLLTHTAGWAGDLFIDTGAGDDALARFVARMAEQPQLAPLGQFWSYNNAAFSLLGRVIEVVTGKSYEAALTELVLEPLGLKRCYLRPADVMTERFAVGHDASAQGAQAQRPWPLPRGVLPAGGIACSVRELLAYARYHLGVDQDAALLEPATLAAMQAPQATLWGREAWGLGWSVDDTLGVRLISHGGSTLGFTCRLVLVPERRFALAVLTNDGGGLIGRAVRWALAHYLGIEIVDPEPLEADPEMLTPYVGRYSRPFADLELGLLAGRLVAQVAYKGRYPTEEGPPIPLPAPAALGLCEPDRLLGVAGPGVGSTGEVFRRADGSIGWLRYGGRLHARQA